MYKGEEQSPPPTSNAPSNGHNGHSRKMAQPSSNYLDDLGTALHGTSDHHSLMGSSLIAGDNGLQEGLRLFPSSSSPSSEHDHILSDLEAINALEAGDLSILASDSEKTAAVAPGGYNSGFSSQPVRTAPTYHQSSTTLGKVKPPAPAVRPYDNNYPSAALTMNPAMMELHQELRVDISHNNGQNGPDHNGGSFLPHHHQQSVHEEQSTAVSSTTPALQVIQVHAGGRRSSSSSAISRGGGNAHLHEFGSLTPSSATLPAPNPTLPPVVISPAEVDFITVQLEKNQQCACKDCGKLFNSVWYLKQHAVKHSNDRPFKCKFCMKTYKFRSNLYQHKCPERTRHMGNGGAVSSGTPFRKRFYTRGIAYIEQHRPGNSLQGETAENNFAPSCEATSSSKRIRQPFENGGENPIEDMYAHGKIELASPNADDGVGYPPMNLTSAHPPTQQTTAENTGLFGSGGSYPQQQLQQPSLNFANGTQGAVGYTPFSTLPSQQHFAVSNVQHLTSTAPPFLSIRERPLTQEQIDAFLQRNRHRVYPCRKCRLHFPCREYLSRHTAWHNADDALPHACDLCPQRFATDSLLKQHILQHSDNSPHRCMACYGTFRSALALRRHKDQCRQCTFPIFGSLTSTLMISPSAPLDQFGFVGSDDESGDARKGPTTSNAVVDEGKGSDEKEEREARKKAVVTALASSGGDSGRCSSNESSHFSEVASAANKDTESPNQRIVSFEIEEEDDESAEDHRPHSHLPHLSDKMTQAGKMLLKQELSLGDLVATDGSDTGDSGFRSRLNSTFSAASTNPPPSGNGQSGSDGGRESGGGSPPPSCTSSGHKSSTSSSDGVGDGTDSGGTSSSGSSSPNHSGGHHGSSTKVGAGKTSVPASSGNGRPSKNKGQSTAPKCGGRVHNRQLHNYYSIMDGDVETTDTNAVNVGEEFWTPVGINQRRISGWRDQAIFHDLKTVCGGLASPRTKLSLEFFEHDHLNADSGYGWSVYDSPYDYLLSATEAVNVSLESATSSFDAHPSTDFGNDWTEANLLGVLIMRSLLPLFLLRCIAMRQIFTYCYLAVLLDATIESARAKGGVSSTKTTNDEEPNACELRKVETIASRGGHSQSLLVTNCRTTPSPLFANQQRHRRPLEEEGVAADATRASGEECEQDDPIEREK